MSHISACTIVGIALIASPAPRAQEVQSTPSVGATPAPAGQSPRPPLCFKVSGFCIERKAAAAASVPETQRLDLEVDREELTWVLAELDLPPDDENSLEVTSKMLPSARLNIPGGPFAVFWAMRHPTQAWRIFLPSPTTE